MLKIFIVKEMPGITCGSMSVIFPDWLIFWVAKTNSFPNWILFSLPHCLLMLPHYAIVPDWSAYIVTGMSNIVISHTFIIMLGNHGELRKLLERFNWNYIGLFLQVCVAVSYTHLRAHET